jgi:predicted transcriptional regulator
LRHRRYAEHISEQAQENIAAAAQHNEVLAFVSTNPASSQASIAAALGWKLYNGEPNKMKASRCLRELIKAKLIGLTRAGRYKLTSEGEAVLKGEARMRTKNDIRPTPRNVAERHSQGGLTLGAVAFRNRYFSKGASVTEHTKNGGREKRSVRAAAAHHAIHQVMGDMVLKFNGATTADLARDANRR